MLNSKKSYKHNYIMIQITYQHNVPTQRQKKINGAYLFDKKIIPDLLLNVKISINAIKYNCIFRIIYIFMHKLEV